MNIKQLMNVLPVLVKANITPNVIGPHGIGKSQVVRQTFEKLGFTVIDVRLGQMSDVGDLTGLPEFDRNELGKAIATRFITPSRFPRDAKCILFFDEVNRATKDILQAVFEMVLDRRMGDYTLPENCGVVTAMNPPTDDYTTLDFNDKAFQDRFCHIKLEPTSEEWLQYAREVKTDNRIVDFISDQRSLLESKVEDYSLSFVTPSRRSWLAVDRVLKHEKELDQNALAEVIYGLVGVSAGAAFGSFCTNYDSGIRGVDILQDYKKVQKKIQKYVSTEENRTDIVNQAIEELMEEAKGMTKAKFTKKVLENLKSFLIDLPLDLLTPTLLKLVEHTHDKISESFYEDQQLLDHAIALKKKV